MQIFQWAFEGKFFSWRQYHAFYPKVNNIIVTFAIESGASVSWWCIWYDNRRTYFWKWKKKISGERGKRKRVRRRRKAFSFRESTIYFVLQQFTIWLSVIWRWTRGRVNKPALHYYLRIWSNKNPIARILIIFGIYTSSEHMHWEYYTNHGWLNIREFHLSSFSSSKMCIYIYKWMRLTDWVYLRSIPIVCVSFQTDENIAKTSEHEIIGIITIFY